MFNSLFLAVYFLTNFNSNSSKDFPLVSGNIFKSIKKPKSATAPNKKKVKAFPKLDNSQGKTNCTRELIKELIKAMRKALLKALIKALLKA